MIANFCEKSPILRKIDLLTPCDLKFHLIKKIAWTFFCRTCCGLSNVYCLSLPFLVFELSGGRVSAPRPCEGGSDPGRARYNYIGAIYEICQVAGPLYQVLTVQFSQYSNFLHKRMRQCMWIERNMNIFWEDTLVHTHFCISWMAWPIELEFIVSLETQNRVLRFQARCFSRYLNLLSCIHALAF